MSRFVHSTLAAAALALFTTAASAQIYPLTNGPNGTGPNAVDSAKGFDGGNAVATEREFLYHPERAGNAAAQLGLSAHPTADVSADPGPVRRYARHHRRYQVGAR